ncbi:hypothetical protein BHM03_00017927 [Ensete ventricosum]|nr:hypothetical protein BHM03_00017927 [Ensete ventricosum]
MAEGIRSLTGVRWELAEGDRELAKWRQGVRQKKTKRLVGRSLRVAKKLTGRFDLHPKKIDSGHWWASEKRTWERS